jgi:hypothetical protein
MIIRVRFFMVMASVTLLGCSDGEQTGQAGGAGGAAGNGGGGAGMGGAAGDGGGGAGGVGGASIPWPELCNAACDKLDATCGTGKCKTFYDCSSPTVPQDPLPCMAACIVAESATCDELTKFFGVGVAPEPPSELVRCVAACPGTAGANASPHNGCKTCTALACDAELSACDNDPSCAAWRSCVATCQTPACFNDCDAMHPNGPSADIYSCTCAITPKMVMPVNAWFGIGDCTDVCAIVMDPCAP